MKNVQKFIVFVAALSLTCSNLPAQVLNLLHTFSAATNSLGLVTNWDGAEPFSDLVLSGGTLYGTAPLGGSNGLGTIFSMNTDGTGFTVLHTFTGTTDGATPNQHLTLSWGSLY